ncbi:MAG: sigma 54-interacting transcriptional regulator [Vicinamibacterales bacterium]
MNPASLPGVMVTVASQRTVPDVLRALVEGLAGCPNTVLARVWLLERPPGCEICRAAGHDATSRSLHLVASSGRKDDGAPAYQQLDGRFHRFMLGERKIGQVALSGEALLISGAVAEADWVAEPAWMAQEQVQSLAAQPLVFRGETLGVLALFDRGRLDARAFEWLRVFADYAAVSIANARALEEVEHLRARLEEENVYLRNEVSTALQMGSFIGRSPALLKVLRQVDLVAPTDATVLVTGESGTGKELIARAIHDRSGRRHRAFIKVNCAAVPEGLFESEFFGHVRGAFTGALKDRPGRFELADGGTLFLDEIGDVPAALQTKLLRVLQEQEFERVGDTRTRRADARIIAATNRDLRVDVESGRFRQDLFYRLSVFPIELPPLRDRHEDIEPLALHFVEQAVRRLGRPLPRVSQRALDDLARHDWPGNVRELQHVCERAVILSQEGPFRFPVQPGSAPEQLTSSVAPAGAVRSRAELRRLERDSIAAALARCDGRIYGPRGAAVLLGMKPTTLVSRVKALGLGK